MAVDQETLDKIRKNALELTTLEIVDENIDKTKKGITVTNETLIELFKQFPKPSHVSQIKIRTNRLTDKIYWPLIDFVKSQPNLVKCDYNPLKIRPFPSVLGSQIREAIDRLLEEHSKDLKLRKESEQISQITPALAPEGEPAPSQTTSPRRHEVSTPKQQVTKKKLEPIPLSKSDFDVTAESFTVLLAAKETTPLSQPATLSAHRVSETPSTTRTLLHAYHSDPSLASSSDKALKQTFKPLDDKLSHRAHRSQAVAV